MIITLPFIPPSVNQLYYSDFSSRTRHKSAKYREFISMCAPCFMVHGKEIKGDIEVEYNFYFPDKRRRDVENYIKAVSDTLVYYGVIEDDSKILRMVVEKYIQPKKPETLIKIQKV